MPNVRLTSGACKIQLAHHVTRCIPPGASRLEHPMYVSGPRNPEVLRDGIFGMREAMAIRFRLWMKRAPPPSSIYYTSSTFSNDRLQ